MSRPDTTFDNLSASDMKKLLKIKTLDDIRSTKLLEEFEDDHIPCAVAKINGVTVSLYWCGSKAIGALEFNDSRKAKQAVVNALKAHIAGDVAYMFDKVDEELIDEYKKKRAQYEVVLDYLRSLHKNTAARTEVAGLLKTSLAIDSNFNVLFPTK